METHVMVSVPIVNGRITLQALRELVDATDGAAETASAEVLTDELRYEGMA